MSDPRTTIHAYISRNPRPGMVLCDDPTCCLPFGHPHYHEADRPSWRDRMENMNARGATD